MADLIERHKITANLPSVMMNYCNRFNSKQLESITEMIYELENSIESADVQPVDKITKIIQARLNGVQKVKIDAMLSGDSTTAYKMVGAETVCIAILQDLEALTAKDGDTNG